MMKFKIGDKVKVKNNLITYELYGGQSFVDDMEKYKSKIVTIRNVYTHFYEIEEDRGAWYWTDEMFENKKQYTYEDLKKSPIGTKIIFEDGTVLVKDEENYFENASKSRDIANLYNLKDNYSDLGKIIKIEEPTYETVYEAKKEILDEVEKRYLRGVIRPFRDKVKTIKKGTLNINDEQYISINFENTANNFALPNFKKGTMYKGMGVDKKYTLEELGL